MRNGAPNKLIGTQFDKLYKVAIFISVGATISTQENIGDQTISITVNNIAETNNKGIQITITRYWPVIL